MSYLLNSFEIKTPQKNTLTEAVQDCKARVLFWALATIILIELMEKKRVIRISIIAVLIYFISNLSFDIISELTFWLTEILSVQNDFLFILFQIIALLLGLLILIKLYKTFLEKERYENKVIYTLLIIYIVLHAAMAMLNYSLAIYNVGDRETYLNHFSLSEGVSYFFPIIALLYFLRRIRK